MSRFANERYPLSPEERDEMIMRATVQYGLFMDALGIDWRNDPNSKNTPYRVAKMFVKELLKGRYEETPTITAFDNLDEYDGMVFDGNIKVNSICSHHHVPFVGVAHVAYIPSSKGKVIGLSKLNRVVEFYAHRAQVQENLTMQIHNHVNMVCEGNLGVAVVLECEHMCCKIRGVKHDSIMKTSKLSGVFIEDSSLSRSEFYQFINSLKK